MDGPYDSEMDRRGFLKGACAAAAGLSSPTSATAAVAEAAAPAAATASSPASGEAPSALRTGLIYDDVYKKHLAGVGHPESPARLDAIMAALSAKPLADRLERIRPREATEAELLACHTRQYLQIVRQDVAAARRSLRTGDTDICGDSLAAAVLAAGGVVAAVEAVLAGKVKNAFCAVRPPGHHAASDRGMGFCIFNNVAVAARYCQKAQDTHRIERVLIADWDIHHGNGTQEIFDEDPTVLYFSTHLSPWYPGTGSAAETGRGKARGTKINCPFPAGAGRKEILGAFQDTLIPATDEFKPHLVLISAGFDSRKDDPLGRFTLTDEDFADLTRLVLRIAARHAGGRVISVLEGGYDLKGLASATAAHVKALTEA